jgi:uncharacterized YkwD family protein
MKKQIASAIIILSLASGCTTHDGTTTIKSRMNNGTSTIHSKMNNGTAPIYSGMSKSSVTPARQITQSSSTSTHGHSYRSMSTSPQQRWIVIGGGGNLNWNPGFQFPGMGNNYGTGGNYGMGNNYGVGNNYGAGNNYNYPSAPSTPSTPTKTPSTPSNASASTQAQQVLSLVNAQRKNAGLGALTMDSALANVALVKAKDMINNNYFDHNSPTYGSPFDMMKQFGITYRTAGENIAKGQSSAQQVMNDWMNSPGHRANILNSSYTKIGVGYYNGAWVQEFTG